MIHWKSAIIFRTPKPCVRTLRAVVTHRHELIRFQPKLDMTPIAQTEQAAALPLGRVGENMLDFARIQGLIVVGWTSILIGRYVVLVSKDPQVRQLHRRSP